MAFKMKGHSLPGINQRKSPTKHFEGKVHDHPSDKKKTSEAMKKKIGEVKASNLKETNKLLVAQGKDPVKEIPDSPAKIAPLVLMGAQLLGKKMMEKKQEKDSPATQTKKPKTKTLKGTTVFGKTIPERNKLFKEKVVKLEKYNPLIIAAKKLGIKKGSLSLPDKKLLKTGIQRPKKKK